MEQRLLQQLFQSIGSYKPTSLCLSWEVPSGKFPHREIARGWGCCSLALYSGLCPTSPGGAAARGEAGAWAGIEKRETSPHRHSFSPTKSGGGSRGFLFLCTPSMCSLQPCLSLSGCVSQRYCPVHLKPEGLRGVRSPCNGASCSGLLFASLPGSPLHVAPIPPPCRRSLSSTRPRGPG